MTMFVLVLTFLGLVTAKPAIETSGGNVIITLDSSSQQLLVKYANDSTPAQPVALQADITSIQTDLAAIRELVNQKPDAADTYTKSEVDAAISPKADSDNVYSKSDVDTALGTKANSADVYTKSAVDTAVNAKADSTNVFTKAEVNTFLGLKANSADVYTKTEVDTELEVKADKSDTYTKSAVDTAVNIKADSDDVYTKAQVDTALTAKANADTTFTKTEVTTALGQKAESTAVAQLKTDVTSGRKISSHAEGFDDNLAGRASQWKYYWNEAPIGMSANYTELELDAATKAYTITGSKVPTTSNEGPYLFVQKDTVHPGRGQGQNGVTADRYAIIGYTVAEAGMYSLTNAVFDIVGASGDGNSIRVYVNDRSVLVHQIDEMGADDNDTFNTFLGYLKVGDVIYVASGPRNTDASDGMTISFDVSYGLGPALTPDVADGGRLPFFGGAYLSTSVYVWWGKPAANAWNLIFDSNAKVLVDRGVYILKAAPSDLYKVGAGWYGEALVSRPFVWFDGVTNDDDEDSIPVHVSGHASNNVEISFQTKRTRGNNAHRLEMRSNVAWNAWSYMELTFLRLM